MELWIVVSVIGVLLFVTAAWNLSRRWNWKIKFMATKLNKLVHRRIRKQEAEIKFLRQLYSHLQASIAIGDASITYQLMDLLKLAYGNQIFRTDEAVCLMSLCAITIRSKEPELTSIVMDGFRPLSRCLPIEAVPDAAEQLTVISAMAVKNKYPFILAKTVEAIFDLGERVKCNNSSEGIAILHALQIAGILTLRCKDSDLLRELVVRTTNWITESPKNVAGDNILVLLNAWLHRIVRQDGITMFETITPLVNRLVACDVLSNENLHNIIIEWGEAAGSACLNPKNKLAAKIFVEVIQIAEVRTDIQLWNRAIKMVGQVSALAVNRHGIEEAFFVLFPLLDTGRKLLSSELKFGQYGDGFRSQQLFIVLRETLILTELKARQSMTISTGEVIAQIYKCWASCPTINYSQRSIKKYCQLLLLYWQHSRQREAKRSISLITKELINPLLLSEEDRKQLGI